MMDLNKSGIGVLEMLLVTFGVTFLVLMGQFHWKRRRLYQLAAKFDGPLAVPLLGCCWLLAVYRGNLVLSTLDKISRNYPSPVKLWAGPYLFLFVSQPEQLEIIMNSPNALEKSMLYQFGAPMVGTGLTFAPVQKWKRNRRILAPTFNQKILNGFVSIFSGKAEILVERLSTVTGKTIDCFDYISLCVIDVFCETAMGAQGNAQNEGSDYLKWVERGMSLIYLRSLRVWYHFEFIFNRTSYGTEGEDLQSKIDGFPAEIVRNRREAVQRKIKEHQEHPEVLDKEDTSKIKPFLDLIIELSEGGAHFTDKELRDEVNVFLIGATDTTAITNSFVLVMLGMHLECQVLGTALWNARYNFTGLYIMLISQEKVFEEIMNVLGPDKQVETKDLPNFQYLERVIKETLRLFPVFPVIGRCTTEELALNDKQIIPVGTNVGFSIFTMHRRPELWPNPQKFDPDRFLPEEVAKRHPYSYVPFSGGPRNCIGIKYGMMAMKSLLATVIRKYKISTEYKSVADIELSAEIKLMPVNGHKVSLELRE